MKHWTKNLTRCHTDGIALTKEEPIISISKLDGKICILEECDTYFLTTLTKEEAIEAFEEAIEFIKSDDNNT